MTEAETVSKMLDNDTIFAQLEETAYAYSDHESFNNLQCLPIIINIEWILYHVLS